MLITGEIKQSLSFEINEMWKLWILLMMPVVTPQVAEIVKSKLSATRQIISSGTNTLHWITKRSSLESLIRNGRNGKAHIHPEYLCSLEICEKVTLPMIFAATHSTLCNSYPILMIYLYLQILSNSEFYASSNIRLQALQRTAMSVTLVQDDEATKHNSLCGISVPEFLQFKNNKILWPNTDTRRTSLAAKRPAAFVQKVLGQSILSCNAIFRLSGIPFSMHSCRWD